MSLAIFDLDNTLIGGDSDHLWGTFLVDHALVDAESFAAQNEAFYEDYKKGSLDITAYLKFALTPLTKYSAKELAKLHEQFMLEKIDPIRLPKAEALIESHRNAGDSLLIITATNLFITGPIAKSLGIDEILASEGELVNGRYTGEPSGIPCFQHGKVERLKIWLEENGQNLENSSFYSDSFNDLPLLSQVDRPVAVDPDDTLRAHAEKHGWEILSLRQ